MFSFTKRKKQSEIHRFIRRLLDSPRSTIPPVRGEHRWETRSNRTLPVLLAPWDENRPSPEEAAIALTKDLSGQGLALVLCQPFRAEQVVVGFWCEGEPQFVLGCLRQNVPLGGGFWQAGIELNQRLSRAECTALDLLVPLAARLKPPRD
jgi:hypothetical protein